MRKKLIWLCALGGALIGLCLFVVLMEETNISSDFAATLFCGCFFAGMVIGFVLDKKQRKKDMECVEFEHDEENFRMYATLYERSHRVRGYLRIRPYRRPYEKHHGPSMNISGMTIGGVTTAEVTFDGPYRTMQSYDTGKKIITVAVEQDNGTEYVKLERVHLTEELYNEAKKDSKISPYLDGMDLVLKHPGVKENESMSYAVAKHLDESSAMNYFEKQAKNIAEQEALTEKEAQMLVDWLSGVRDLTIDEQEKAAKKRRITQIIVFSFGGLYLLGLIIYAIIEQGGF